MVDQSCKSKTANRIIHWVDLHMGPITWQIRDLAGLHSATDLLHRAHTTAVAIFLDGPAYAEDPAADDHQLTV